MAELHERNVPLIANRASLVEAENGKFVVLREFQERRESVSSKKKKDTRGWPYTEYLLQYSRTRDNSPWDFSRTPSAMTHQ